MLNKKLAEMNENGTLPIFKNYLANISANPTKVKSLSNFEEDGWYEVTDVDGFEKYLVYHYDTGKKISVRYIFGKTPKIQEASPKGFFGEIADVISVFAYDSTLAVSKLNTEEGSAVKLVGYDTEGNLVEDDIPEGIVVDDALNTESDNAIANAPVATALNEKADTADLLDGSLIPNKALQAKSIEAVSVESGAVQDTPFIYQGTGTANGTSIADTSPVGKHLEKQGNSVVVNQLVQNNDFSANTNWTASDASMSISGGVATFTATAQNGGIYQYPISFTAGHKYLVISTVSATNGASMEVLVKHGSNDFKNQSFTGTGSKQTIFVQFQAVGGNGYIYPARDRRTEDFDAVSVYFCAIIDLTQWFAGNIPQDLLDHPENFFRYCNGSLAYNAGSMENGTGRYLTCGGRNVWDEEWELGNIDDATGADASATSQIRSKYFKVIPNTTYHGADLGDSITGGIYFYDKNMNYIFGGVAFKNTNFVTPSNCYYARFRFGSGYGTAYKNDITISLYYETGDSYDQYFPYEEPKVYDTGSEVLYGIDGSRDIKTPDGTITRVRKRYKLKDLTYTLSEQGFFYATISDMKYETSNQVVPKLIATIYTPSTAASVFGAVSDKIMSTATGASQLWIRDSSYNDATAFKNHFTDDDYVEIELAEPTTEQGTPFAENIEINDYGTMGWDSEVPQGCKIFYPADYALAIDSLGQRPDINWDMNQVVSHTELNNETDALEAKDTQLLNAVGGTLRQLLAVSKSIDFANTDFVDLGELEWQYISQYSLFQSNSLDGIMSAFNSSSQNAVCTLYKNTTNDLIYIDNLTMRKADHLYVKNTTYTDATAFKAAMKGVLLAYEKAE